MVRACRPPRIASAMRMFPQGSAVKALADEVPNASAAATSSSLRARHFSHQPVSIDRRRFAAWRRGSMQAINLDSVFLLRSAAFVPRMKSAVGTHRQTWARARLLGGEAGSFPTWRARPARRRHADGGRSLATSGPTASRSKRDPRRGSRLPCTLARALWRCQALRAWRTNTAQPRLHAGNQADRSNRPTSWATVSSLPAITAPSSPRQTINVDAGWVRTKCRQWRSHLPPSLSDLPQRRLQILTRQYPQLFEDRSQSLLSGVDSGDFVTT